MANIFKPNVSWTKQEAFYCIIAAAAWADYELKDEEDSEISALCGRTPTLRAIPKGDIKGINRRVVRGLQSDFESAVERACASLPEKMRLAAFCHAVDIVYADNSVLPEEARYLNKLVDLLDIDEATAQSVAKVFLDKNSF